MSKRYTGSFSPQPGGQNRYQQNKTGSKYGNNNGGCYENQQQQQAFYTPRRYYKNHYQQQQQQQMQSTSPSSSSSSPQLSSSPNKRVKNMRNGGLNAMNRGANETDFQVSPAAVIDPAIVAAAAANNDCATVPGCCGDYDESQQIAQQNMMDASEAQMIAYVPSCSPQPVDESVLSTSYNNTSNCLARSQQQLSVCTTTASLDIQQQHYHQQQQQQQQQQAEAMMIHQQQQQIYAQNVFNSGEYESVATSSPYMTTMSPSSSPYMAALSPSSSSYMATTLSPASSSPYMTAALSPPSSSPYIIDVHSTPAAAMMSSPQAPPPPPFYQHPPSYAHHHIYQQHQMSNASPSSSPQQPLHIQPPPQPHDYAAVAGFYSPVAYQPMPCSQQQYQMQPYAYNPDMSQCQAAQCMDPNMYMGAMGGAPMMSPSGSKGTLQMISPKGDMSMMNPAMHQNEQPSMMMDPYASAAAMANASSQSVADLDDEEDNGSPNEPLACYVCRGRRMCFCYFLKVRYYKFPSFLDLVDHQYKKWRHQAAKAGRQQS